MNLFVGTNLRTTIFIGLGVILLFCTGCSRADKEENKLSISIPSLINKAGSLANSSTDRKLIYVVINVKSHATNKIETLSWSGCSDCSETGTPPKDYQFVVNSGSYLIQALAVYKTATGGEFLYDDTTAELKGESMPVTLYLEKLGGDNQSLADGRIIGRYLTGTNVGPTDIVNIFYHPVGADRMILMKSSIVNGWFNFFALENQKFSYETAGGIKLFTNVNYLNDTIFKPATGKPIALVKIPAHQRERYEEDNNGNSVVSWDPTEEASNYVVGWWGSSSTYTANKHVCYTSASEVVPYKRISATKPELLWKPNSTSSDDVRISGGTPDSNIAACDNPSIDNAIQINPYQLDDREGFGGVRGAFASLTMDEYGYTMTAVAKSVEASNPDTNVKINMFLMPGVKNEFTGVRVYATSKEFHSAEDGAPCELLAANKLPDIFSKLGEVPMSAAVVGDSGLYELPIEIANAFDADELPKYRKIAVCPYNAKVTTGGVFVYDHILYPYSGGMGYSIPTALNVRSQGSYYNGTCVPVEVEFVSEHTSNGSTYQMVSYNEENVEIDVTSADPLLKLYQTNNCSDSGQQNLLVNVPAYNQAFTLYAKSDCADYSQCASTDHGLDLSGENADSQVMSGSGQIQISYAYSSSDLDVNSYDIQAHNPQYQNECRPFYIQARNYMSTNVPFTTDGTANLSLSSSVPGAVQFYTDLSCTTISNTVSVNAHVQIAPVYYKVAAANGTQFVVTVTDGVYSDTFTMITGMNQYLPPNSVNLYRYGGGSFSSIPNGTCFKVSLSLNDVNGMPTAASTNLPVEVSNGPHPHYLSATEAACATTTNQSALNLTIPQYSSEIYFWIRKNGGTGGTDMNIDLNGSGKTLKNIY